MQKILVTMWYIWKARNDQRFGRKTWNTWQVHHAVAAYINTANSPFSVEDAQDYATQEAMHNTEAVTSNINAFTPGMNNEMTGATSSPEPMENNEQDDATRLTVHLINMVPIRQGILPANTNNSSTGMPSADAGHRSAIA